MDFQQIILNIIVWAPPFLFALTVHELAHGYVALRLGDPTAKNEGRLTMNPLKHLDPIGTIAFFIIHIGWAKPVPVNPVYFKDQRQGMLQVALAGPVANIALAVASALLYKFFVLLTAIPLPVANPIKIMLQVSVWVNIMLALFNFLPIPPLDGSKILVGLLSPKMARTYEQYESYGFIIVLILFVTGVLGKIIIPMIDFFYSLLM